MRVANEISAHRLTTEPQKTLRIVPINSVNSVSLWLILSAVVNHDPADFLYAVASVAGPPAGGIILQINSPVVTCFRVAMRFVIHEGQVVMRIEVIWIDLNCLQIHFDSRLISLHFLENISEVVMCELVTRVDLQCVSIKPHRFFLTADA